MTIHESIEVDGGRIHVAHSGSPSDPAILFLHGWPENWKSYEKLMSISGKSYFSVALDLPGIGGSIFPEAPYIKTEIAKSVHQLIFKMKLSSPTLVGHDVGGQIAFSYLQQYPDALRAAVILDVVIPGLKPWEDVLRNPYLWHFAFHSIPQLPETVVSGNEKEYFEFFYTAIAAHPERITAQAKEEYIRSYSNREALSTGFNWYRGFQEDSKINRQLIEQKKKIETPVLYMRGKKSGGEMLQYAEGLGEAGIRNLTTRIIPDSGHFMAEEQPELVWRAIAEFLEKPAQRGVTPD
jgi:pimeloyl-ACP methyl ester carboxylesterase